MANDNTIRCTACDGLGVVERTDFMGVAESCSRCDGTGRIKIQPGTNQKPSLSLLTLRRANQERKTEPPAFSACHEWGISDWYMAMNGEAGELANLLTKVQRGDVSRHDPRIADEFADVLIYLDILAADMGVDLSEAVTRKFNRTSQNVGSKVFLRLDSDQESDDEDH